jgi:hypothetical protein
MPRRASCCVLLSLLAACGNGDMAAGDAALVPDAGADELPAPSDADGDGLCDLTEDEFGTDPAAIDSDRDGLPDLTELVNGFDATDPESPVADQLGYLEARLEGGMDFPIRATVDGDGQGISGSFRALAAVYADGLSAADFFAGATAVAAHPVDGVRSINAGSAHFASVLGKTRLAFNVRFEYPFELLGALDCARSYPFRYAIKTDDGDTRHERLYLLIVVPEGSASEEHCLPRSCQ